MGQLSFIFQIPVLDGLCQLPLVQGDSHTCSIRVLSYSLKKSRASLDGKNVGSHVHPLPILEKIGLENAWLSGLLS